MLPIKSSTIAASGIGVYLVSMALKKAVIISDGPSVRGILNGGEALIIPPDDPIALETAVKRVWEDVGLRQNLAEMGFQYAMRLGGDINLLKSVVSYLELDSNSR